MAVNYVNSGERVCYIIPKGIVITSGNVVILHGKGAVALSSGTGGDEITLMRTGRFTLPKFTDENIEQFQTLYWNKYEDEVTIDPIKYAIKLGIAAISSPRGSIMVDCILVPQI